MHHLFQSLASPAWVNGTLHRSRLSLAPLLLSLTSRFLHILQRSNILSILQNIKSLFLPSLSHPLPFAAFFPSSRPLLLLLLPTPSFSIHISGGRLYECVCICTIFSRAETYIFSFSPPLSPPPLVNTDPAFGFVLLVFF